MSNVRRVYVEKKPSFAVKAKELKHEISSYPVSYTHLDVYKRQGWRKPGEQ